jgi:formylglycine-generating enzyme required for sulfatase activity
MTIESPVDFVIITALAEEREDDEEFVTIPAGHCWLGATPGDPLALENEKPGHEAYLKEFQIGRYPVTNREYAQFIEATHRPAPAHWANGVMPPELAEHPVVNVDFADADAYCRWLSATTGRACRLPTEAEWEKAARGSLPNKRLYVWDDKWRDNACNTQEAGRGATTAVTEYETVNRSVFGVVDLLGNVWEWTTSWYEPYAGSSHKSDKYGQQYRVVRGGSWRHTVSEARLSARGRYAPDTRRPYLGFRVASAADDAVNRPRKTSSQSSEVESTSKSAPESALVKFDRIQLLKILTKHFDLEELKTLCLYLDIDFDSLPAEGKVGKARELVVYCERHERLPDLIRQIKLEHPNINW